MQAFLSSFALVAMAAPPGEASNPLFQLIPLVPIAAIFYFLILRPSRQNQARLTEFLAGLKVGDKVVTTGGLFGTIARVEEQSVHLQVAPNVRLEVARSAIAGYQGQPPVATGHG